MGAGLRGEREGLRVRAPVCSGERACRCALRVPACLAVWLCAHLRLRGAPVLVHACSRCVAVSPWLWERVLAPVPALVCQRPGVCGRVGGAVAGCTCCDSVRVRVSRLTLVSFIAAGERCP